MSPLQRDTSAATQDQGAVRVSWLLHYGVILSDPNHCIACKTTEGRLRKIATGHFVCDVCAKVIAPVAKAFNGRVKLVYAEEMV